MKSVSVIIPAMNEEQSVGSVVSRVRQVMDNHGLAYDIIVIDDGSSDDTRGVARAAGARVIRHAYNMGNGAAIKTGVRHASGDIIVFMDADGQHDPNDIPRLLDEIDTHGMVVGARTRTSDTDYYRDIANAVFNLLASYVCAQRIPDLTSGFRAIHTPLLREFLYLLPNTFSYPTTITLAVLRAGHCVAYVPVETARRVGRSKIKPMRDGARFLVMIFKITMLFSPLRIFLPVSLITFGMGVLWYIFTLVTYGPKMPPASTIMLISGVLIFLMGLISEQIAQLRYDRSESSTPLQLRQEWSSAEETFSVQPDPGGPKDGKSSPS